VELIRVILAAYWMLSGTAAAQGGVRSLIFFSGRLCATCWIQVLVHMHSKYHFIPVSGIPDRYCWHKTQWVWTPNKRDNGEKEGTIPMNLCYS